MKVLFQKFTKDTLGGVLLHLLLAFIILIILALLFFFIYLPNVTNHGESITVPSIEGMQVSQLDEFLLSKDLRYEVNDSSYSADFPPLTVLKQYPRAGSKVKEGRKIFISLNRINPPTVPIPENIIDGTLLNAESLLKSNELKRGHIQTVSGPFKTVKEMKLKGVKVEAGTRVPKGSVIDLVVMDGGQDHFEMGDLVNQEFEDAKMYILGTNLNMEVVAVEDTVGIVVVVLKQMPEPGENIKVGDVVKLWVGKAGTEVPEEEE